VAAKAKMQSLAGEERQRLGKGELMPENIKPEVPGRNHRLAT
jgi:hypothetical protein